MQERIDIKNYVKTGLSFSNLFKTDKNLFAQQQEKLHYAAK